MGTYHTMNYITDESKDSCIVKFGGLRLKLGKAWMRSGGPSGPKVERVATQAVSLKVIESDDDKRRPRGWSPLQ